MELVRCKEVRRNGECLHDLVAARTLSFSFGHTSRLSHEASGPGRPQIPW